MLETEFELLTKLRYHIVTYGNEVSNLEMCANRMKEGQRHLFYFTGESIAAGTSLQQNKIQGVVMENLVKQCLEMFVVHMRYHTSKSGDVVISLMEKTTEVNPKHSIMVFFCDHAGTSIPKYDLGARPGYAESAIESGYNLTSTAFTQPPHGLDPETVGPLRGGPPRAA